MATVTDQSRRSRRHGKLNQDEHMLVEDIGESYKAFATWPASPEFIPIDIALRAAERAYRRGVTQGAYFMLWHLLEAKRYDPNAPGQAFASRLWRWRMRGNREEYAKAELPPRS